MSVCLCRQCYGLVNLTGNKIQITPKPQRSAIFLKFFGGSHYKFVWILKAFATVDVEGKKNKKTINSVDMQNNSSLIG